MAGFIKRKGEISFDIFNYLVLTVFMLLILYPLYYICIASVSDPFAVSQGKVVFRPVGFTLEGYEKILSDQSIWTGYRNSIFYAVAGTLINLAFTIPAAFSLSRKELAGRKIFMYMIIFTMFFSGGMIPTYFVVRDMGMINTVWAMLLPGAIVTYNLIVAKSFFQTTIPDELVEAAFMDGSSYFRIFFTIVLPLSKAILAVMVLFYAVGHWNAFFSAMLYISKQKLFPLQLVLRNILVESEADAMTNDVINSANRQKLVELIKYGIVIVSSVPVLLLYPIIQKQFVQGVMIGSVKG